MYGTQTMATPGCAVMMFENDVKMYGTQTKGVCSGCNTVFENDVKMYGTQTKVVLYRCSKEFENDVKMYGVQHPNTQKHAFCHLQHPVRVFMCTLPLAFFHSL